MSLRAETLITINEFISFIIFFILAFGIAFQLPIIMWLLTKLEIEKTQKPMNPCRDCINMQLYIRNTNTNENKSDYQNTIPKYSSGRHLFFLLS